LRRYSEWPGLEDDVAAAARNASGPSRYAEIANRAAGIRGRDPSVTPGQGKPAEEEEEMTGNPFGFLARGGH